MPKAKKNNDLQQKIDELTTDLQRSRADFENYRKRVEAEKVSARGAGRTAAILQLLPVIDTIDRAVAYAPEELKDHRWVQGVTSLTKQLEKTLEILGIKRIDSAPGNDFNPELHEAVQFDDEAAGDKEVIAEAMQSGYTLNDIVIRPAMVKVTRK